MQLLSSSWASAVVAAMIFGALSVLVLELWIFSCWSGDTPALVSISYTAGGIAYVFGMGFLFRLRCVLTDDAESLTTTSTSGASDQNGVLRTGHLRALGAGTQQVPRMSLSVCKYPWASILTICTFILSGPFQIMYALVAVAASNSLAVQLAESLLKGMWCAVAWFLGLSWWLTLKMASALTRYSVAVVQAKVKQTNPSGPEWEAQVVPATLELANEKLPVFSDGWGSAVAWSILACWSQSLSWISWAIFHVGDDENTAIQSLVTGLLWATVLPFGMIFDAVSVSNECDVLVETLHQKRTVDCSDTTHHNVHKLEIMLGFLNKNQGPGFVAGGLVLDRGFCVRFFAKLAGLTATAIGSLLALQPTRTNTDANACELTKAQTALLAAMAAQFNNTCHYTVSLGPE